TYLHICVFFFFSSRRRHTRCLSDWSSDVCSSDLSDEQLIWTDDHNPPTPTTQWKPGQTVEYTRTIFIPVYPYVGEATLQVGLYRSEERRVGKECRSRRAG